MKICLGLPRICVHLWVQFTNFILISGSLQARAIGVEAAVQERARALHRRRFDGPVRGRSYLADHLCLHLLVAVEQNLRRHGTAGDRAATLFRAFAILLTKFKRPTDILTKKKKNYQKTFIHLSLSPPVPKNLILIIS